MFLKLQQASIRHSTFDSDTDIRLKTYTQWCPQQEAEKIVVENDYFPSFGKKWEIPRKLDKNDKRQFSLRFVNWKETFPML